MAETKIIASGPVSTGQIAHYPLLAVIAVLLGSSMANIDSRMFSIGLPDLKGAFSLSYDEGAWLSTASTASQIFIAPAVAWLATVFGLRRILGVPSLVFAVISLIKVNRKTIVFHCFNVKWHINIFFKICRLTIYI